MTAASGALRALVALACVHGAALQALYPDNGVLTKLDSKGWEAMQADLQHVWVVEFYADWCGHCKQFASAYQKAAASLAPFVKFGAVNADVSPDIMAAQGVNGYPTVKIYLPEVTTNPYTGKRAKEALSYDGPRTAKGLVDFVTRNAPNHVVPVTSEDKLAALKADGAPHLREAPAEAHARRAVLITAKTDTSLMLKSLALALRGRMAVGEAKRLSDEGYAATLAAELGVDSFPALIVLPGREDGEGDAHGADEATAAPAEVYGGQMKYEPLMAFLAERAGPPPAQTAESGPGASGAGSKRTARNLDGVELIDGAGFAAMVEEDEFAWVIAFEEGALAEGADDTDDAARVPGLARLAAQVRGMANVGLVNASEASGAQLAAQLGVDVFPALRVLPYGAGLKTAAAAVTAADAAAARKAVGDSLPAQGVELLNMGSMDPFMARSAQPPGAAGATAPLAACILFSDKRDPPALYKALSLHFSGVFDFGMVPAADAATLSRFQLDRVPSLLCLYAQKPPSAEGAVEMAGAKFDEAAHGKMSFATLGMFLSGLAEQRGGPGWHTRVRSPSSSGGAGGGAGGGARSGGGKADDTTVHELTSKTADDLCSASGGLCAIALLDGDRSPEATAAREGHLTTLGGLALRRRGDPSVRLSWLDATCQDHIPAAFEISDADLPTLLVIAPSKGRYAKLMGTFTVEGMSRFINAVVAGRASTMPTDGLPALDASLDCDTALRGAAKAAALEAEGGEEDMGDIMAEILEEERERQAALEAELAAQAAAAGGSASSGDKAGAASKSKEEMTELERLEAELEDCGAHDLLCQARRDKQLQAIEKRRRLEEQIAEAKKKQKKKKKKAKKASSGA